MIRPRCINSLTLFFPCYNEEANIGSMIEQAVKVGEDYGFDYEVVIVDDGSRDRSAEIVRGYAAKNNRVKLVQHPKNMGYGAALRTGFAAATKDYVFMSDGDSQFQISEIEKLFSKIDGADVVVGFRIARQDAPFRRLNGFLWTRVVKFIFGLKIRDIDCAFKLFKRKCLQGLPIRSNQLLIHAEVMARLNKKGCRIEEIGVTHYPRTAGKATATGLARIFKSFLELSRLYWEIR